MYTDNKGKPAFTWTVEGGSLPGGSLPAGLSLGANGVLSSTPPTAVTRSFTVNFYLSVDDSITAADIRLGSKSVKVIVDSAGAVVETDEGNNSLKRHPAQGLRAPCASLRLCSRSPRSASAAKG